MALLFSGSARATDDSPIQWKVMEGEDQVDRGMADRLYEEACRWVAEHFQPGGGKAIRPSLTIHVGESCPDSAIPTYCLSAGPGDLYLPRWDEASPAAVIQATIMVGMLQLARQQDMTTVVSKLLADDSQNFVSARAMTSPPRHAEPRRASRQNPQSATVLTIRPVERSKD